MRKTELVHELCGRTGLARASAEKVIDWLPTLVAEELAKGGEVYIPRLGTFRADERAARTGRNPRTGETIRIPARKVPGFRAARALKEAVDR